MSTASEMDKQDPATEFWPIGPASAENNQAMGYTCPLTPRQGVPLHEVPRDMYYYVTPSVFPPEDLGRDHHPRGNVASHDSASYVPSPPTNVLRRSISRMRGALVYIRSISALSRRYEVFRLDGTACLKHLIPALMLIVRSPTSRVRGRPSQANTRYLIQSMKRATRQE